MRESKLSSKGQIVVPASVRAGLGLEPGDRVRFEPHPDGYLLRKAQDASWVDRLVSVGGNELRGYAEQLLRERHGRVDEPLAWLQRMEAFPRGSLERGRRRTSARSRRMGPTHLIPDGNRILLGLFDDHLNGT